MCGTFDSLMSRSHTRRPLWKTTELLLNYTPQVRIPADRERMNLLLNTMFFKLYNS